ncbi:MAG: hypothetical protein K2Y29_19480 [Beijerinckiaceae bacterium]|nr:hypothetical protein [Beijerinckiaceae bacterium]
MSFLIKSAVWLALVFLVLPPSETERMKSEINSVAQDKSVRSAVDRTHQAIALVATEAQRMCDGHASKCVETASTLVKAAAGHR